jgi:hypothetical protein
MPDYTPVNTDNAAITLTAGAILTGGLLVCSSGADDTVVHTTSSTQGRRVLGVTAHDAPSGGRVTIYLMPGYLHALPAENGVTMTDGDLVVASTTPGRITSVPVWSTTGVTSGGAFVPATQQAIGTVVRATTGSTAATVVSRFLGI